MIAEPSTTSEFGPRVARPESSKGVARSVLATPIAKPLGVPPTLRACHSPPNRPGLTPGFTLVEVAVAATMLAALLALVTQMMVVVRAARRNTDRQFSAQLAADNLLERISSLPWESIEPDANFAKLLDTTFVDSLGDRQWSATVAVENAPVVSKRITVTVLRKAGDGADVPVRLTAWVFRRSENGEST